MKLLSLFNCLLFMVFAGPVFSIEVPVNEVPVNEGATKIGATKETIKWIKWNLVPEYIEDGKFSGQGYLDKFLEYTQAQYPEYDHEIRYYTPNRIDRSWAQGNYCTVHLWLGYWPEKIVYSNPYGFTPRFGLVTEADSKLAQEFKGQESISLRHLLENTDYSLGVLPLNYRATGNSRYPQLEPYLSKYKDTPKVKEFSTSVNEMSVKFLDRKRVDYILRMRITHYSELRINGLQNRYQFHYIDEGMTYKKVAAACSNSSLGRKVIDKFNSLINDDLYETYLKHRQEWDANNNLYEQIYTDYFLNRKPNPNIVE